MKKILTTYANKMVDNRYYSQIIISGKSDTLAPHELTEEEYRAGKQGMVWMDSKTNKLVFKDHKDDATTTT